MPKRKQKKGRKPNVADPLADEKIRKLNVLLAEFRNQCTNYERHLLATCEEQNAQISKLYDDKLACIPKHTQEMTIAEIIAQQEKERRRNTECPTDENFFRSRFERQRQTTEKKRTLKKDRKRSVSANTSTRPLTINKPSTNNPFPPRMSKALSESSLATPVGRFGRVSNLIVTPKFDPSVPASKFARKPKPNEVVMSISGSPLQNYVDQISSKLTLSLGHMRVLTFDEEATIDKEFVNKMDEPLKEMLRGVKNTLDDILKLS